MPCAARGEGATGVIAFVTEQMLRGGSAASIKAAPL